MLVTIIGAGAAGCFAAIELKRLCPNLEVKVLEGGNRPLAKVMITGGGRCNLTNSFLGVKSLEKVYPRGHRLMKHLFHDFDNEATFHWWENEGVRLLTQADECVFPRSQRAGEIVEKLLELMRQHEVDLITQARVTAIRPFEEKPGYELTLKDGRTLQSDVVLIATGGVQTGWQREMLEGCPLTLEAPLPSLFSFVIKNEALTNLTGLVVRDAVASLPGTKFKAQGALLITHWGLSGPAILKLSSYAARWMAERDYRCPLSINWMQGATENEVRESLNTLAKQNPQKFVGSIHPNHLQSRLWCLILQQTGIGESLRWCELSGKPLNRLVTMLTAAPYAVEGKNRFKEEFVTCGGVALGEINPKTLESKKHPGLYLAGEVLDVDAITGGFNLQAAWTMGFVAAKSIAARHPD